MFDQTEHAGIVFVSYSHEDSPKADRLTRQLMSAGLRVWRDATDLWPGEDWRARIRTAITSEALIFVACFSPASIARRRSYQNEELVFAIEDMRLRPFDVPWIIPVRFGECEIPDRDLGDGRTLRSLHPADLFGADARANSDRLIITVLRRFADRGVHTGRNSDARRPPTDDHPIPAAQDSGSSGVSIGRIESGTTFISDTNNIGQLNIGKVVRDD